MRHSTLSIMCIVTMLFIGLAAPLAMADDGRRANNATVSFGQWQTDPPFDRTLPLLPPPSTQGPNDRTRNEHQLIPNAIEIKAGGSVNFIISGFHQPIVYGDGTQPGDINVDIPTPPTTTRGPNPFPRVVLIDDPTNRIYRGLNPSLQPLDLSGGFIQDRVEVSVFS